MRISSSLPAELLRFRNPNCGDGRLLPINRPRFPPIAHWAGHEKYLRSFASFMKRSSKKSLTHQQRLIRREFKDQASEWAKE